jgi:hypothetical protein
MNSRERLDSPSQSCPAGYSSRSRRSARVPDKKVAAATLGRHHPESPHFIALRRVVLLLCARIARGSNLFPTARGVRALRGRKPTPLAVRRFSFSAPGRRILEV